MYKVEYHPAVKKDLKKIDPQNRKKSAMNIFL